MIKYIGSKRRLVPHIVALAEAVRGAGMPVRTPSRAASRTRAARCAALDLFTGTTRVAQGLKAAGFAVTANDVATYSEVLARTYIETDAAAVDLVTVRRLLSRLSALPGRRGYFTRTFCEEARYVQPFNGERIDAIRAAITRVRSHTLRTIALTSLLEAADRVDSTTGVQMAYLKQWSARSHNPLDLRLPALLAGTGRVLRMSAERAARAAGAMDLVYLDPPYNQHSYFGNYHVWETLVRGDAPSTYGIARKREDVKVTKSAFNRRGEAWDALVRVLDAVDARHAIVSFSNEGFFTPAEIRALLRERFGDVAATRVPQRRYIGAQIGVYNPRGERVGRVSHVRNTEWLFVAGRGAKAIIAAAGVGRRSASSAGS